jgi:hypothetical protein
MSLMGQNRECKNRKIHSVSRINFFLMQNSKAIPFDPGGVILNIDPNPLFF